MGLSDKIKAATLATTLFTCVTRDAALADSTQVAKQCASFNDTEARERIKAHEEEIKTLIGRAIESTVFENLPLIAGTMIFAAGRIIALNQQDEELNILRIESCAGKYSTRYKRHEQAPKRGGR